MTFLPPQWLSNPHVQTIAASLPFWAQPIPSERLLIPVAAGRLHAYASWHASERPQDTVVLVHGVGGSHESRYLIRAATYLFRSGMHVVRLDMRGAGDSIPDVAELYHAGLTEDIAVTLGTLAKDPRVSRLSVVGFSLGGNTTLKLAGEWGDAPPPYVSGVVAISPPLDLNEASRGLERRRSYVYRHYVLRKLIEQGVTFRKVYPQRAGYDAKDVRRLRSIRDYDSKVVVPMHGFDSVEDYYQRASSGPYLPKIAIPTLLLYAEDDPMVPVSSMRPWMRTASTAVNLSITDRGGHVAWLGGMNEHGFVSTWPMSETRRFLTRLRD
jgi:predicted alpha/beta-fold hydrolase